MKIASSSVSSDVGATRKSRVPTAPPSAVNTGRNQNRPTLCRSLPPRTDEIRVSATIGTTVSSTAVFVSNAVASTGMAMIGKPKPMMPCMNADAAITPTMSRISPAPNASSVTRAPQNVS